MKSWVKRLDISSKCISTHAFYDMVPLYYMQSASFLNIRYATVDIVLIGSLKNLLTKDQKPTKQDNILDVHIQPVFPQQ